MTAPTEIRQRAIALIEKLPEETLIKAIDLLESLCVDNGVVTLGEETLLQRIQRRLPTDDQTRLTYLRQRNETGEITETEHQELLGYVDRVERQDAERAEALIQLARLRNVELKTLLNEFLPVYTKPNAL
ncbi:MAG: hypothetical protein KME46_07095 [Brasilonema angustatum HA4187-MV1]|jgi:hypothetical protein|nr:hypothetical protein [Brasilonema angustatum HA4187-MV1]